MTWYWLKNECRYGVQASDTLRKSVPCQQLLDKVHFDMVLKKTIRNIFAWNLQCVYCQKVAESLNQSHQILFAHYKCMLSIRSRLCHNWKSDITDEWKLSEDKLLLCFYCSIYTIFTKFRKMKNVDFQPWIDAALLLSIFAKYK